MEVNMATTITGETILLVEDERATAEVIRQMVRPIPGAAITAVEAVLRLAGRPARCGAHR